MFAVLLEVQSRHKTELTNKLCWRFVLPPDFSIPSHQAFTILLAQREPKMHKVAGRHR